MTQTHGPAMDRPSNRFPSMCSCRCLPLSVRSLTPPPSTPTQMFNPAFWFKFPRTTGGITLRGGGSCTVLTQVGCVFRTTHSLSITRALFFLKSKKILRVGSVLVILTVSTEKDMIVCGLLASGNCQFVSSHEPLPRYVQQQILWEKNPHLPERHTPQETPWRKTHHSSMTKFRYPPPPGAILHNDNQDALF